MREAMDKIPFIRLWDIYKGLLTPTQQEITDMYFNLDLTLSEIADEKGITRQGVSECLKTCKRQLEEYEEKLHFSERLVKSDLEFSFILTDIGKWAENFATTHPEFKEDMQTLESLLKKDYSEEVEAVLEKPETAEILNADYTEQVYGHKKTGED